MAHPIVEEELALLGRVTQRLAALPEPSLAPEAALERELVHLQSMLNERVKAEDAPALHLQLQRQTALLRQLRSSREAPRVDPASPYFAHLRLREGGQERDLLLGKATCIEGDLRIVDWRNAPVSKIFYRYGQGEEYEEEMAGRVRAGTVVTRRAVTILRGALERIDAPEGVFTRRHGDPAGDERWQQIARERLRLAGGEGAALRAHPAGQGGERRLGTDLAGFRRRADKRLPELAGLLDPEQFALITRQAAGFVVIRGSAGSGKTTVALHRIAYLAYDDPRIDSERTLFVVFSHALGSYVSHVLPALGVSGVQVKTFSDWASEQRRRLFPELPREVRENTPAEVHRLKLHPVLLHALEDHVRDNPAEPTAQQALDDWASVLCNAPLLEKACARHAPGDFRREELDRVAAYCRARLEELEAWMEGDPEAAPALDPEDDALLLRAYQLRVGPIPARAGGPLRYRHVAIDEVQDFSPVEVRVLIDCLDEQRSLTLAGDTQQHVMEGAGFTSWSDFFSHLGLEGTAVETLRVSYRSSEPIVAFAQSVLGSLQEDSEPPLTVRSGPAVECFEFTESGACIAFLADALRALLREEPLASVALLTPSPEVSALYHRGLEECELPRLRRVEYGNFTFAPGVEVTEIAQAKGLEFDYVILVEAGGQHFPATAAARRLLHVGATRAVHQLWVTCSAARSPIVDEALAAGAAARPEPGA
ncbi:MAG TPA: 3'-5' exonuclease [Myxococcota bacterium]|nr:3'-5' exonuclease [Myxococcota bacterium]